MIGCQERCYGRLRQTSRSWSESGMRRRESVIVEAPRFERICRTSTSEAYLVVDGEEVVARVDLHFTSSVVYGVLIVEGDVDDAAITELRSEIRRRTRADRRRSRAMTFYLLCTEAPRSDRKPFSDEDDADADLDDGA